MKVDEAYSRFWLSTLHFETPPRFGFDWFVSAIDKLWEAAEQPKYRPRAVDWLGLELFIVDVLGSGRVTDKEKVRLLKEGLDAFTGRGHFGSRYV